MIRPRCQFAHQRDKKTQNSRSLGRKHGRRVPVRWDFAAELLLKAAETRKESDVDMATAQMERALRVEGWL